jgi:hypothetical protein
MQNWRLPLVAALSLLLPGCSSLQHGNCAPGEQAAVSELLYFGTNMPGGIVTPEEWTKFLSATVTPRSQPDLASGRHLASGSLRTASLRARVPTFSASSTRRTHRPRQPCERSSQTTRLASTKTRYFGSRHMPACRCSLLVATATANPSLQPTRYGLRPSHAAELKRYAP